MKFPLVSSKAFFQKAILLFAVLPLYTVSFAQEKEQNLVPNPSFEKHKNKSNIIKNAIPWQGDGTVDYYMAPEKTDTSKYKGAHTGTCFVGLRFQAKYKEYLFVQLTEPLKKGKTYSFKMYIRLVGCSTVTIKQLGVYFSDRPFEIGMTFDEEGLLDSAYTKGIPAAAGWIPIHGEYLSHGNEKFIIVGNFQPKMKDDFVRLKKWDLFELREAYYYIDDISIKKIKTEADSTALSKKIITKAAFSFPDSFSSGQIIEINDLKFENEGTALLKSSYKILDELVLALNNHPFMEIQINVYSDFEGKESLNKKLSKAKAKAVYDYLLAQSVINPMTYKGFGSSQPATPNDPVKNINKDKNSRVEFMVILQ